MGTPKGRLTKLEKDLLDRPWQQARPGVTVKLLPQEGELYVLARSADRVAKERSMRRRQLKRLWLRLHELQAMKLRREELLMKLGAARQQASRAWRLVAVEVHPTAAADHRWICLEGGAHVVKTFGRKGRFRPRHAGSNPRIREVGLIW